MVRNFALGTRVPGQECYLLNHFVMSQAGQATSLSTLRKCQQSPSLSSSKVGARQNTHPVPTTLPTLPEAGQCPEPLSVGRREPRPATYLPGTFTFWASVSSLVKYDLNT